MRKLIVCNIMTLDGYYEGPGKNVMDVFAFRENYPQDESFDLYNAERLRSATTLLLGRASYEGFKGYWPSIADNTNARPVEREISRLDNTIEKVVVSDTLTAKDTDPWQRTTRIIKRADAHAEIAELKHREGKDILMFGSHILWNDLLAHGLVDELHIIVGPHILGAGTPLFSGQPPVSLRRMQSPAWKDSGLTLLKYEVQPKKS